MSRLWRWFRIRNSRIALDEEWHVRLDEDDDSYRLRCTFPVSRNVIGFAFACREGRAPEVTGVDLWSDTGTASANYSMERSPDDRTVTVHLQETVTTTGLIVHMGPEFDPFSAKLRVTGDLPPDVLLLVEAARQGLGEEPDLAGAIATYARYEAMTRKNPHVARELSRLHRKTGSFELAEEYALRCLALGRVEDGFALFDELPPEHMMRPVDDIRRTQTEAAAWELGSHYGAAVLDRHLHYRIVRDGGHVLRLRESIEVRRAAAARMLRSISFPFSSGAQILLHTTVRIVHADGEVEEVPRANFSVTDSDRRNVFIPMETEKQGLWILPDLARGDIIDWSYHLFTREWSDSGPRGFFITCVPFNGWEPTFHALTEFDVDSDLPVRFACRARHSDLEERRTEGERLHVVFEGRRYVPVRNVAYSYPDALDPVVACGWGSGEWRDEAHRVRKESFGLEEFVEPVPEPLAAAMAGDNGAVAALERAFYWTRDKLKYAALPAAMRHIGGNDRGREIVRAGTGDCKDKSYLLALVCRDLGIPCEFVLASSKRGVIQEDLPGPQFDHVFVRAQGPEGWLYMDPASPQTVFGSPHPNQQGMRGMVLNDEARFFTYPADPPERNRLTIREQLTGVRDSWVEGTFEIEATGNVARETDEVFKGASLSFSDPLQAAENALGGLLSQVVIDEFERLSDTGVSDVFRVRGRHRRSPLATLELSGRRTARLTWIIPPVPSWFWRKLTLDTMFEVRYPVHAVIELEVTGDLRRDLEEVSGTPVLRNELGTIEHTRTETEDSMIIRREISFWEKQVEGERLSLVAPMMEALEQALRIVLSFRSESQTDV